MSEAVSANGPTSITDDAKNEELNPEHEKDQLEQADTGDPEDDLKEKQADLKKAQTDIASLNQSVSRIQSSIKVLEAKIADLQQALAGYEASAKSGQQQRDDAKNVIAQKAAVAEAVVKDKKDEITQKIAGFDAALRTQETNVSAARDSAEAAANASADAEATALQKQAEYDAEKQRPKDRDAELKELAGLLDQAAKMEAQADYVGLYFLIGEAKSLADQIEIPSAEEYTASLRKAQRDLGKAKQDAADRKEKAVQLLAAYNGLKKKHEAAKASRRSDLLVYLKQAKPNP